jgi:hypothetical protein
MRNLHNPQPNPKVPDFDTVPLNVDIPSTFYVTPDNARSHGIMATALEFLDLIDPTVIYFNSSKSAEDAFRSKDSLDGKIVGVDFHSMDSNAGFSLRFDVDDITTQKDLYVFDDCELMLMHACRDLIHVL